MSRAGTEKRTGRNVLALGAFLLICLTTAGLGSLLTLPAIPGWYASLEKPAWTPPNAVFSPVWTTLFVMMAVAAWLVWRAGSPRALPLTLFGMQLVLNAGWSGLFFALRSPGLAFAEILLLWAAILATLVAFWRVRPAAGLLLVPYLLWVSYAVALNFAIWRMNP
jgi:benzodiazapine receptor